MLSEKINLLKQDELVKGSIILFLLLMIFNFLNYVFQISMAKLLGPADYGVLAVLMSFIYIISIPSEAIQTIISKYTSKFNSNNNLGEMKDLLLRSLKKGVMLSFIAFLIFLPIALVLSKFLNIEFWLIAITGLSIFYVFIIPILRGIIQGRKKFVGLGINLVLESFIKVIASILLVVIGFRVYGAMFGLLIAFLIAFILAFYPIKGITQSIRKRSEFKEVYSANFPVLIAITSVILIYSLDIILARRFFSPEIAGQYAFVSLIGKVVIFSSSAIGKAMFPISSENFENGKRTSGLLKKALILVSLISVVALFFYITIPKLVIIILSLGSQQYLYGANILFTLGLAFSFVSLSNILILYNISINKMKKSSFGLIVFVILEIILLSIFNSNLREFSIALLFVSFIMMIYSIIITKLK